MIGSWLFSYQVERRSPPRRSRHTIGPGWLWLADRGAQMALAEKHELVTFGNSILESHEKNRAIEFPDISG